MVVLIENTVSVREAAQLLGVTEKQVQHLGRTREISYVARGLLDATSVRTYQAVRQGQHTRGWSGRTAWAAIGLLSGGEVSWLGQAQVSRLRSRLLSITSSGLVAATRNRAHVGHFTGHDAARIRLQEDPRTVGRNRLPGLVGAEQTTWTDWYVDGLDQARLTRTYGLRADAGGGFILRSVATEDRPDGAGVSLDLVRSVMHADQILTALDAATSEDPRERGVAMRILDESLERFRAHG